MDQLIAYLLGARGSLRITDTEDHTRDFNLILVLEDDTTIGTLEEDGTTTSLGDHGISAVNLLQGEVIVAKTTFTKIALTDGKVQIY